MVEFVARSAVSASKQTTRVADIERDVEATGSCWYDMGGRGARIRSILSKHMECSAGIKLIRLHTCCPAFSLTSHLMAHLRLQASWTRLLGNKHSHVCVNCNSYTYSLHTWAIWLRLIMYVAPLFWSSVKCCSLLHESGFRRPGEYIPPGPVIHQWDFLVHGSGPESHT